MPVSRSVQEFLRQSDAAYTVVPHAPACTARQEAATTGVPARNWAKVVICFAGGEPVQAVVPADSSVDLERLARLIGTANVRLANEDELDWMFPDCEVGSVPPLGPLYHQLVFVDARLADNTEIVFNGGSLSNAIMMTFADFVAIARPIVGDFARQR